MVIQYLGQGEVKIVQGESSISFAGGKLRIGGRDGFDVYGPGEYEVDGTFVKGIASGGVEGKINTVYCVLFDDIRLCHLGALAEDSLSAEIKEAIGEIDVLFVPTNAPKLASALAPKILVPLYKEKGDLQKFLKEMGEKENMQDKLLLKRKDLEGKEGEVVCLSF
ncbi:MAG TPA: MBL fold metallo-hydrolase [Candidatus Paceibacterota bacterium]